MPVALGKRDSPRLWEQVPVLALGSHPNMDWAWLGPEVCVSAWDCTRVVGFKLTGCLYHGGW